jgi:hypothetical protein
VSNIAALTTLLLLNTQTPVVPTAPAFRYSPVGQLVQSSALLELHVLQPVWHSMHVGSQFIVGCGVGAGGVLPALLPALLPSLLPSLPLSF